jgi:D-alanyl-D-alanine carboxypeptidase
MSARVRGVASLGVVVLIVTAAGCLPAALAKTREKPEQGTIGRVASKLSKPQAQQRAARARPAKAGRAAQTAGRKGKAGQTAGKSAKTKRLAKARGSARKLRAQAEARRRVRAGYSPPSSAIVVDANAGTVLADSNADAIRHPASLTKIMTLYMLFEQLEAGKLKLDSPIVFSSHSSSRPPTKLGVKPGESITVEDAIKALVTRSANDAAAAIAETIGGDEKTFARMMTRKARALGMDQTTYVNASGLPDPAQVTSARDQAILGRAIQDRFPDHYRYFRTTAFSFKNRTIGNHNRLLGSVHGVDGIKTGYTEASGYNLDTSIHRGSRFLVAVVLGGNSARARDDRMRSLIEQYIGQGQTTRTAPAIVETIALAGDPSAAADVMPDTASPPSAPATPAPTPAVTEPAAAAATASAAVSTAANTAAPAAANAAASTAPYKVVRTRAVIPADDPPAPPAKAADVTVNATATAHPVDVPPSAPATSVAVIAQGDADPGNDGDVTAGQAASASLLPEAVGGGALRPMLLVLGIALVGVFGLQLLVMTSRRRSPRGA